MAVQFITGPAGSGKSTYVMNCVAKALRQDSQKKIILMVPEQATFCYQYELITQYGLSGVLTLEVLSFQRLARTVMQQKGGMARQDIDKLGKLLVLRRIIQQHSDQYPYFSQSVNRSGYLTKLGDTIQELKRYQISAARLGQVLTTQNVSGSLFGSKISELSMLYDDYEKFLAQDYLDSEDALNFLLNQLEHGASFTDTEIWVDEFYDFTPQELNILGKLMKCARNVYIVLPIDSETKCSGRQSVFRHTKKMLDQLRQMAVAQNVEILPDYDLSHTVRWTCCADLEFLEREYFLIQNQCYTLEPEHFTFVQGQNRLSEVDYTAREIRRLCREEGYRYSDIAVFTRGDQYNHLLETIFADYDIPYFIDHKETVNQHPLTELLLAVFEIVQTHWNYQSVFHLLKTGLLPFTQDEIDKLENYVLQYGIRGSAWYREEPWKYPVQYVEEKSQMDALAEINALRIRIAKPLHDFQITIQNPQPAGTFIYALYSLLESYHIPEQLEQMCKTALTYQLMDVAQVHQQIWTKLIHIFDQMTHLLQDTLLSLDEFATILQFAVQNMDLGLLPSSLDQVFVGVLAHSRARNVKVAFVLGLNEGVFPARSTQDGFFSDMEKHLLQDMGIQLSQDSSEQIYEEQFMFYLAMTRASERLFFTYSLSDEDGKALHPSMFIEKLYRLFPVLKEEIAQWPPDHTQALLPYLNHRRKALSLLGGWRTTEKSVEQQSILAELYQWFCQNPDEAFQSFQKNMLHAEQLPTYTLKTTQLFGSPLRLSVSALETYQKCPYRYYLQYGLRLQERALYQMAAVDTGTFYHTAIEQFSNYLLQEQITWQSLDAEEVKRIMAQIVDQLVPQIQNQILLSSGRYQYIRRRLQKTLEESALLLLEHGKRGDFVPIALEADFGFANSKIPSYHITLQDGTHVYLQGKIDRIEQAQLGNIHYLRVIDFKSGKQGLDLTEVYYGLKIQLLTYLHVALQYYESLLPEGEALLPAGVLYYFFRSGIVPTEGPMREVEAKNLHQKAVRADGLLLADMHALKLAQHDLTTGNSTLLPVNLLTKAAPYIESPDDFVFLDDPMELFGKRNTTVVSKEQLELLLDHVQQLISAIGEEIHSGNIAVRPCRLRTVTGCTYCSYQTICQIQTVDFAKNSKELLPISRDTIWNRLKDGRKTNTAYLE